MELQQSIGVGVRDLDLVRRRERQRVEERRALAG